MLHLFSHVQKSERGEKRKIWLQKRKAASLSGVLIHCFNVFAQRKHIKALKIWHKNILHQLIFAAVSDTRSFYCRLNIRKLESVRNQILSQWGYDLISIQPLRDALNPAQGHFQSYFDEISEFPVKLSAALYLIMKVQNRQFVPKINQ